MQTKRQLKRCTRNAHTSFADFRPGLGVNFHILLTQSWLWESSLSLLSLWCILFQIKLGLFRENLNLKKHLRPKNGWSSPSTFWHRLICIMTNLRITLRFWGNSINSFWDDIQFNVSMGPVYNSRCTTMVFKATTTTFNKGKDKTHTLTQQMWRQKMYNKCEDKRHTTNVKTKGIQQRRRQSLQVKPDHVAITILVKKTAISKHYFILLYISYKHVIYCSLLFQKKNRNLCGSVQILCFCNGVPPTKNVSTKL